jgi:hypothetical protein
VTSTRRVCILFCLSIRSRTSCGTLIGNGACFADLSWVDYIFSRPLSASSAPVSTHLAILPLFIFTSRSLAIPSISFVNPSSDPNYPLFLFLSYSGRHLRVHLASLLAPTLQQVWHPAPHSTPINYRPPEPRRSLPPSRAAALDWPIAPPLRDQPRRCALQRSPNLLVQRALRRPLCLVRRRRAVG